MKITSLLPTLISVRRNFSQIPNNVKILIRNEFLGAKENKSIKDTYEVEFKIIVEYKSEEKLFGSIEITYTCLILKEIDDKIELKDIKGDVYPSIVRALWNVIAKDIMDLAEKVGLPNPIPIGFVFKK